MPLAYLQMKGNSPFWAITDVDAIKKMPIKSILSYAEKNSEFAARCCDPKLDSFWIESFRKLLGPDSNFIPNQIDGLSLFTQYQAQYYYHLATLHREFDDMNRGQKNIAKAIQHHSFGAIATLVRRIPPTDVATILNYLTELRPQKATPALLMYARTYIKAALTLRRRSSDDIQQNNALMQLYLDQAYLYLHLAEEAYSQSSAVIHNASYGEGLARLFPDFKSFNEAKENVLDCMELENFERIAHVAYLIKQAHDLKASFDNITSEEDKLLFSSLWPDASPIMK